MTQPVSTDPAVIDLQDRVGVLEQKVNDLQGGDTPTPVDLQPPTGFTAVMNANRSVTCNWVPPSDADNVEVHEFETDPLNTLKGTYPVGTNTRTSGVLTGGHNYTYGVRSKKGAELSAFAQQITLYIPTSSETTTPTTPPTNTTPGTYPSDILDLRLWTVMLPTGSQGSPDNDYMVGRDVANVFFVSNGAVVCRTRADGVHSSGSQYPRTEMRQMSNTSYGKAAWSSSGSHTLQCDMAISAGTLSARKRVVGMQIHDSVSDVCELMLHETQGLGLMHNDGNSWASIDPNYVDGTRFVCKIDASADRIKVTYNGVKKVDIAKSGSSWYFKFGCYLQSNVAKWGESGSAYGQSTIWAYTLTGGAS